MKHINVALFVPDMGCPHRCSFCNQKTISGKLTPPTAADVERAAITALESRDCNQGEIAFFGGSFTAIERGYMLELLSKAGEFVKKGFFKGIRISTRPDCIDREIVMLLKQYGVSAVELGCQSMSDEVLRLNNRGHSREHIIRAAECIRQAGIELGVQMMTGLYGDTHEGTLETARELISLSPATVRIYPTVVLEGTELEALYRQGKYQPQTLYGAAQECAQLLKLFHQADIRVIRLGLHSGGNVEQGYVAGAYHPAFREICESIIYMNELNSQLSDVPRGEIEITVGKSYVSMLTGQKKANIRSLEEKGYKVRIVQDQSYPKYKVTVRGIEK